MRRIKAQEPDIDSSTKIKNINEMIIKHLRREKTEEAYTRWIKKLKQQYTIEINSIQWEKILGSNYIEDRELGTLNSINK